MVRHVTVNYDYVGSNPTPTAMNTKSRGNIAEAKILAACLIKGWHVSLPFGDNMRYDLVIERKGVFERVQCKMGWLRRGVIRFATSSSSLHRGGKRKDYRGQIDWFGIYCPDNRKTYLVPVDIVGRREGVLRIDLPSNGQRIKIRWAKDFKF